MLGGSRAWRTPAHAKPPPPHAARRAKPAPASVRHRRRSARLSLLRQRDVCGPEGHRDDAEVAGGLRHRGGRGARVWPAGGGLRARRPAGDCRTRPHRLPRGAGQRGRARQRAGRGRGPRQGGLPPRSGAALQPGELGGAVCRLDGLGLGRRPAAEHPAPAGSPERGRAGGGPGGDLPRGRGPRSAAAEPPVLPRARGAGSGAREGR
mmetsp:Transcript_52284/g.164228  ORF Transcript_52284/g.164228 Transcript_52284/m.164228 type:complete len:207 (-) Transcript_52284:23-643(-)